MLSLKIQTAKFIAGIAANYQGEVFGGFVRDVLIPELVGLSSVGFVDLDIWFKDDANVQRFLRDFPGLNIVEDTRPSAIRMASKLYSCRYQSLQVDIVVCDTYPVDDFDVNCASIMLGVDKAINYHQGCSLSQVVSGVLLRRITVLDTFTQCEVPLYLARAARMDAFLKRGWSLYCRGKNVGESIREVPSR